VPTRSASGLCKQLREAAAQDSEVQGVWCGCGRNREPKALDCIMGDAMNPPINADLAETTPMRAGLKATA